MERLNNELDAARSKAAAVAAAADDMENRLNAELRALQANCTLLRVGACSGSVYEGCKHTSLLLCPSDITVAGQGCNNVKLSNPTSVHAPELRSTSRVAYIV